MIPALLRQARSFWVEYPRQYWILFFGAFINSAGAGLVFPFLSLYLTKKLKFSMTEVGISFAFFAVMSVISQVMGGVLADRWGRKPVMLISLLGGAAGILLLGVNGLVDISQVWVRWGWVMLVVVVMGLTNGAYGPAVNAMVADLIEGSKRQQAYGLLRVVQNLGISIGPAIGGFIANISYFILFVVSAATAVLYSLILALMIQETRPQAAPAQPAAKSILVTAPGFRQIFLDSPFISFCLLIIVSQVVYSQMNTTLPVFLNKDFGVTEQWYGLLMSLNAFLVVLLQFRSQTAPRAGINP
jgi:oligosaccharide:H+ symporter